MLTLYHNEMSTASQKVRFVLSEKGLEWQSKVMNLATGEQYRREYLDINPNGVVPALVDGGRVLVESTVINEYLEEAFSDRPLLPTTPTHRARVREWTVQVDESIHAFAGVMSLAIATRFPLLEKACQDINKDLSNIPDVAKRERLRDVIFRGMDSPFFPVSILRYQRLLKDMERALGNSSWLADSKLTLADIAISPFVTRMHHLCLDFMWASLPKVANWYERLQELPSYQESHVKWFNQKTLDLMAGKGEVAKKRVRQILDT